MDVGRWKQYKGLLVSSLYVGDVFKLVKSWAVGIVESFFFISSYVFLL